jgi:hypothetical protein
MLADFWCIAGHWLQVDSGIFGAIAAFTWLAASRVKGPDGVTWSNEDALALAVTKQSRLNALAAMFAAIAAFCQLPQAVIPASWS